MQRIVSLIMLIGAPVLVDACRESTPPQAAAAAPIAVSTSAVTSSAFVSVFEAGGIVRARATAVISSRIMAPVTDVRVRAGDRVRSGSSLVVLDGREIEANRARATATLASATEAAQAAQAEVRSAQAAVTLARATHDRVRTLHEKRSATTQELDQAVSALDMADAQIAQAQSHLAAANAARDAARAASDAVTITSSYTVLSAPFDGVVTERSVDPGSMATPGLGLITVEDTKGFRLEVPLDESRAAQVAVGEPVMVRLGEDRLADPVPGRVSEIARVDPASHSFLVKIELPSATDLRSGVFGRAQFTGESRNTLSVPAMAAVRRGQLTFVFTVDRENRARLRAVSPGSVSGDRLEILAGLRENDTIITNPPPSLTDGAAVSGARR